MPRVTEEHRSARRDEIADAALRVLERRGVAGTSIAHIVEESGLSAGAIYGNFASKADLARFIASKKLVLRLDALDDAARDEERTPVTVLRHLLRAIDDQPPTVKVLLQFWAEATVDDELAAVVTAQVSLIRERLATALGPWAAGRSDDPGLAVRTARTLVMLGQGFLVNAALFGEQGRADAFVDGLGDLLS